MNILDTLKKLLKNNQNNLTDSNLKISLNIDDYDYLSTLIDKYIKEYKEIISSKDKDKLALYSSTLREDIKMNVNLAMKIFFSKDDSIININKEKLELYITTLTDLENIVIARLLALKTIYEEKDTIIDEDINAKLLTEIEYLNGTLNSYLDRKHAINFHKAKYQNKVTNELDKDFLLKRREFLLSILKLLSPEKEMDSKNRINIREDMEHISSDIAFVEKIIETYVYKHRNEKDALKFDIHLLWNADLDFSKKEELLSAIKETELQLLTFYYYGDDYIGIEDLMELYLLKFNVLTLSENGIVDVFIDEDTNDIELNCYMNILKREILALIKGDTSYENPKIGKVIKKILANGKNHIDYMEILENKYLLNIILAMDSITKLINVLKNFKVEKKDYKVFDFCDKFFELFEWDDVLPLETVYRIMQSQNVDLGSSLYTLLHDYIYPDRDKYYLPEGLKAINYHADSTSEEEWLSKASKLTLNKARDLMYDKEVIIPTSLVKVKNGNTFFADTKIKRLIFPEGLKIEVYDTSDIEVIGRLAEKISIWDAKRGELITSSLRDRVDEKWGNYDAALLKTEIPHKDLVIEEFNHYEYASNVSMRAIRAINAREDDDSILLRRAYANVTTKYGDFCLHIEEKYTKYGYGPYRSISLYHGSSKDIMIDWKNDFDFTNFCIFRTKFDPKTKFYQWIIGYSDNMFNNPKMNIWLYDETYNGTVHLPHPIYSVESRVNTNLGVIIPDGSMRLGLNKNLIPEMIDNIKVNEYENHDYTSKAYFGNPAEHLAILKDGFRIKLIYKKRNRRTDEWQEYYTRTLSSDKADELNKEDLENVIECITDSNIDKYIKSFIIEQLQTYINIRFNKPSFTIGKFPNEEIINVASILRQDDFYDLVNTIEYNNISEYVEKMIETLSDTFKVSIDDLLGITLPNEQKRLVKTKNSSK